MTVHRVSSLAWERGTRLAFHLGSLATRRLHIGRPDVGEVTYRQLDGDTQQVPPADQSFWAATAVGTGPQTLTWEQERGEWAMVIMNADATPGSGGRRLGGGAESPSTWCSASMKPGTGGPRQRMVRHGPGAIQGPDRSSRIRPPAKLRGSRGHRHRHFKRMKRSKRRPSRPYRRGLGGTRAADTRQVISPLQDGGWCRHAAGRTLRRNETPTTRHRTTRHRPPSPPESSPRPSPKRTRPFARCGSRAAVANALPPHWNRSCGCHLLGSQPGRQLVLPGLADPHRGDLIKPRSSRACVPPGSGLKRNPGIAGLSFA
jgi:hypothetical protein